MTIDIKGSNPAIRLIIVLRIHRLTINRRSSDLFPINLSKSSPLPFSTHGVDKFIDSISHFPCNSTKDEIRMISNF